MIKNRCEVCGRIYLGERCQCQSGKRRRKILCECGKAAYEVYVDKLGEWPMCRSCLDRVPEAAAEMRTRKEHDIQMEEIKSERVRYPYGLTARQYEIALLSHLTDEEIAEKLSISPATVGAHQKIVFKKLGVRSRYEIRHVLPAEADAVNDDEGTEQTDESSSANECSSDDKPAFFLGVSTSRMALIQKLLDAFKEM